MELIRTWHHGRKSKDASASATSPSSVDAYDDCLAYLDDQLGRSSPRSNKTGCSTIRWSSSPPTMARIRRARLYGHGKSLYRPETHVPLLVFGPVGASPGPVIAEPVSLRDVAATVVERLGLTDDSPLPGSSLARSGSRLPLLARRMARCSRKSRSRPASRTVQISAGLARAAGLRGRRGQGLHSQCQGPRGALRPGK